MLKLVNNDISLIIKKAAFSGGFFYYKVDYFFSETNYTSVNISSLHF